MEKIVPTAKQMLFHRAVAAYEQVGFGGARGPGKSFALCHEGLRQSLEYPGNIGVIARKDLVDLRDTTEQVMRKWVLPPYEAQGLRVKWEGGGRPDLKIEVKGARSTILWRDAKDEGSLMSGNVGWAAIDEAVETSTDFYLAIQGATGRCVIPDGRTPPSKFFCASNPGPGWMRTHFPVGPVAKKRSATILDREGQPKIITRAFIPALACENPHLPPDYEAKLREIYPDAWVRRYLEGSWDVFEGMIYTEFDESRHVRAFDVPAPGVWREIGALDWGFVNPCSVHFYGVDYDDRVFVWGEHYRSGWRPSEHAAVLKPRLEARRIKTVLADPSAWGKERDGVTVAAEFLAAGVILAQANNEVAGGIQFNKRMLADDRVTIHPECVNLIREIKEYRWAPQTASQAEKGDPKEQPVKKSDHAVDDWRYAANHIRFGGLKRPEVVTVGSFADRRMAQLERAGQQEAERGRW